MSSSSPFNFNPFGGNGENWFKKPPQNPLQPLNFLQSQNHHPFFASISLNPFKKPSKPDKPKLEPTREPGEWRLMLGQFYWEVENQPDYRHAPEVEKILNTDPADEWKDGATEQEVRDGENWMEEFRDSPVGQFLKRAEEIADKLNEMELKENEEPYRKEDNKFWKSVPNVIGLDGRPMPRKSIKTKKEAEDKFWDFARQFFFGLWGYRQRPYPPGRPIDVAQAIGYKNLEKRYYDFIMRSGGFYYKDRLGRTRGPCELIQLKTAWGAGIIDKHTFIWGEDLDEWVPIGMLYGMERAIATWEVRLGAAGTAFIHKLQKGIPPWVPLKGFENKTYKQLQEEAYESKRRDLAVLEANDGIWPGVRIPNHALFLWAGGSELTTLLEEDHMPNKFIPKDLRRKLAKVIPGLRPWEVLSVEQAMSQITYGGKWHREPLGYFTTGPPYIQEWNTDVMDLITNYQRLCIPLYNHFVNTIPGFEKILEKAIEDAAVRRAQRLEKREAQKKAEQEMALLSRIEKLP